MLEIKFFKMTLKQCRLSFNLYLVTGILSLVVALQFKNIGQSMARFLTGDHFYSTFTVLTSPIKEKTKIQELLANIQGVESLKEVETDHVVRKLNEEMKQTGIDLPSTFSDTSMVAMTARIDPFLEVEEKLHIKEQFIKILKPYYPMVSQIKMPDLIGKYTLLTALFIKYGALFLFVLMAALHAISSYLFIDGLNQQSVIWASVQRNSFSTPKYYFMAFVLFTLPTFLLHFVFTQLSWYVFCFWLMFFLFLSSVILAARQRSV
jgi:hypothetical protein